MPNRMNVGTTDDILISNGLTDIQSVDSIAKLNIMTEANNNFENNVPQIMLSQTTNGSVKIWNGDRLTINYASGNNAGYFGISEITGGYRQRLNLEILGANNVFHTSVQETFGNSFLYSQSNKLSRLTNNSNFLHSDYNNIGSSAASTLNFINSNNNTFYAGSYNGVFASANNLSFYNSNYNTVQPTPSTWTQTHIDGTKEIKGKKGCYLRNQTFIGSNFNYVKGRTISNDYANNTPNCTFINTSSGFYKLNENHDSFTLIGNTLGYFNNARGNIIGIGEGLLQDGGNSDKILLGFYNQNTTDPNEILVVGDGRLNREYVKGLVHGKQDWERDVTNWNKIMTSISSTGSVAANSTHYRHNIFTVNKEGYITISDYRVPTNSARYGYKGITAFVDGTTYEIPFDKVYSKINGNDAVDIMQERIDSYTRTIENKVNSIPVNRFETFNDPANIGENIQTSGYILMTDKPHATAAIYIIKPSVTLDNNEIINVSYQPTDATRNLPAKIVWEYRLPVVDNAVSRTEIGSTNISPYCTKQFIFIKPPVYDTTSFSGITLVEND